MKKFSELRAKLPPEVQVRATVKTKLMANAMALDELRTARNLTQKQIAEQLKINQAAVSKLERRADMYISTLANFIKAMGGTLEIYAAFPDGKIAIKEFNKIGISGHEDSGP